jgi:hypothetical protein
MRQVAHLSFADAAAWSAAHAEHFTVETGGGPVTAPGVHVVERGTEYDPTGETVEIDGHMMPVVAPRAGYRVDVLLDGVDLPVALWTNIVNETPRHQFMGYGTCVAPETAPDDGDEILVERADGQAASDADIARDEAEHVRRKLTAEQREDRRALFAATLAVIAQRAVRDALVAERDTLNARRDALIAALVPLTGAARAPLVAERNTLTNRLQEIAPLVVAANAELLRLRGLRADALAGVT